MLPPMDDKPDDKEMLDTGANDQEPVDGLTADNVQEIDQTSPDGTGLFVVDKPADSNADDSSDRDLDIEDEDEIAEPEVTEEFLRRLAEVELHCHPRRVASGGNNTGTG